MIFKNVLIFLTGSGAFQAVDLAIAIDVMPNKEESASALGVR
jgi:hypothetical protein